jgi:hypothetical protein
MDSQKASAQNVSMTYEAIDRIFYGLAALSFAAAAGLVVSLFFY